MHSEWDTQTVTNTLALYGAKHHSPAYYAVRFLARTAVVLVPLLTIHAIAYTLFPA